MKYRLTCGGQKTAKVLDSDILFMGGSWKEAILFERAVRCEWSYRTNNEFLGYRQLKKSCNSAHVGARYHCRLPLHAGVKGVSERSELTPCNNYYYKCY